MQNGRSGKLQKKLVDTSELHEFIEANKARSKTQGQIKRERR
jgi:hypothetical protein